MPFMRGVYLASAIDLLPGLDRDADLLAVLAGLETDARGLAVLGHVRDLGDMQRRFRTLEPALRIPLARLDVAHHDKPSQRSEEHTSELQSLMRISYAVFCLKKKKKNSKDINSDN